MARAQRLAERGLYTCMPNPRVGCVIVKDGAVIGEGWHQQAGQAHAEINALAACRAAGHQTAGSTVYVTLEPCCHQGKTGPCTQALIDAGVANVVIGMEDPNPQVAGQGIQQLRAAGIDIAGPLLEEGARALNPGFIKRMQQRLPLVRLKMAMSVDGRTAMASGESKWITGTAARRDVQRWRARSCAVVTGIGTVLQDDPALTVRAADLDLPDAETVAQRQPLRVVIDSRGRLPDTSAVLANVGHVLVINADQQAKKSAQPHVEQLCVESKGGIDLQRVLRLLAERQCNEVLVEAGATLAGSFIEHGLVDELIIYMAPKLLGSRARPLFELPLDSMAAQLPLSITEIRAVGDDWRITAKLDKEM